MSSEKVCKSERKTHLIVKMVSLFLFLSQWYESFRFMSLGLLQSLQDMSRHERDFLGEMPVNDKGKGAREGEMSLHMAVQICPW